MLRKKRLTGIGKINKINFRNEIRYNRIMDVLLDMELRICPAEQRLNYKVGLDDMFLSSPLNGVQFVFDYMNILPLAKTTNPHSYFTLNKFMVSFDVLLNKTISNEDDEDIMNSGYYLVIRTRNDHEMKYRIINDISLDQYNILRKLSRLSSETNFTITDKPYRYLSGLEDELHINHHTLMREKCPRGTRSNTYYAEDDDFTYSSQHMKLIIGNLVW